MADRLRVVRFPGSRDTVRALEALLADARAGRLIGIAYVAMYGRGEYVVGLEGETRKSPTMTRGMLHLLDDELSEIIHKHLK